MQLSQDVLAALARCEVLAGQIRIVDKLDRPLYLKVNDALTAIGGKWNRKVQAHVFPAGGPGALAEQLDRMITTGEVATAQDLGFFPTPAPLARELVELAGIMPGMSCLEPSAGDGAIVRELFRVSQTVVTICEHDGNRRDRACAIAVGMVDAYHERDFLDVEPEPFDRVVMNPPFCKVGKGDHLDHVRHAYQFLHRNGVIVSVLPAGVLFRQDRRHMEFRKWAEARGSLDALPDDSFKASGTRVRTCVLRIEL